jgi:hypothetical protein
MQTDAAAAFETRFFPPEEDVGGVPIFRAA